MADISQPEEKAKNFGIIGAAFGVGFILGPALGGVLGEINSRAPFFLSAFLTGLNFLFGFFVLPESLAPENKRKFRISSINPFGTILKVLRFKGLQVPFCCFFVISVAHWVYPAVWSYWSKEVFGWGSGMIGFSLACYGIGISVVQGYIIRLAWVTKLGPRLVVTFSLSVGAVALFWLGFVDVGWMVFCIIPFSALSELLTPTLGSFISNKVSDVEQGELQGVLSSLSAVTSIVSPLIMAGIFKFYSSPESELYLPGAPFIFAALLLTLTIVPLWSAMTEKKL